MGEGMAPGWLAGSASSASAGYSVSAVCLLIALFQVVPGAPLIVAANRDELLARPAVTMTVLRPAGPRILGGRDELAGGTWLAVNEHGLVAGLTNRPVAGKVNHSGSHQAGHGRGPVRLGAQSEETASPHPVDHDGVHPQADEEGIDAVRFESSALRNRLRTRSRSSAVAATV